ncbi:PPOX class F420-dependent oxidoreductase [Nocardia goodfellowii]|uniref:PPOX class probable F420-dependent enzyme n=1 Tax=Nocardia goodfellowii TaxID=882446 RepID=A0ABS4QLH3_9NOCA|nr:PPOX class F420-dependent oxidoreductase [Nocardia goodfellowii]MBP2192418.1 PPOX class probable F420-dependent enzyme [Nocardia goodfellowii]
MAEFRDRTGDVDDINRRTSGSDTRAATILDSHIGILGKKAFAHLASLGPGGAPQSHPVWFDFDPVSGRLLISTGTDRQKYRNIRRDPRVSVSILDPDDPYRYLEIRGHVVMIEPDPGKAFLDRLARKYLDLDTYPYEQRRNVERVIVHIRPDHIIA